MIDGRLITGEPEAVNAGCLAVLAYHGLARNLSAQFRGQCASFASWC